MFTMQLAFVTVVNVWAFMESEGAELAIEDVDFAHDEPSSDAGGLDVIVLVRISENTLQPSEHSTSLQQCLFLRSASRMRNG
jgi:hypothetical protein